MRAGRVRMITGTRGNISLRQVPVETFSDHQVPVGTFSLFTSSGHAEKRADLYRILF